MLDGTITLGASPRPWGDRRKEAGNQDPSSCATTEHVRV